MIKEAILKLAKKQDLTASEARACMNEIMDGQASDVQMSSYLTALSLIVIPLSLSKSILSKT